MNIQPLVIEVKNKLKTSAFRFFEPVGYGIDYKNSRYYFLDEIGSRIIKDLIECSQIDIESIAAEYDAPIELILEDTIAFLQTFLVRENDERTVETLPQDDAFLSYFAENKIPLSATIEITEACNEHCVHCYRPAPSKEAWSIELFERTCIELKSMGTLQIDFTGGEPFLKKGFVDYVKIANKHGFILSILTNATLISDDAIAVLKSARIRNIYVSVYSGDPAIHDAVTRLPGSFYQTVATIKKLTANNIPVFLNAPIMAINKDSPQGITSLADSLGLEVKFAYKITESYNKNISTKTINVYSKEELSKQINDPAVNLYSEIIQTRKTGGIVKRDRIRTCDAGFRSITISPEGDIVPCTALRLKCGNIRDMKISELWNSNQNMEIWRNSGSLVKNQCKSCSSYDYCEPCPAGYFAEHNSLDGIDDVTCGFGKTFSSCVSC